MSPSRGRLGTPVTTRDLQDYEEIRHLKSRYFRWVDQKQWDRMPELFLGTARFEGLWAAADGPSGFIENLRRNLTGNVVTVHHGGMAEFVRVDDERIRAIWSMTDYLTWPAGSRGYLGVTVPDQVGIRGYGYYEEEYQRTADGWRIAVLRLTRIRIDPILDSPQAPEYPFMTPDVGWLDVVSRGGQGAGREGTRAKDGD